MQDVCFPPTAVSSDLSAARLRLAVVSPTERPPEGLGWLDEAKHDGHRLAAILDGTGWLKLISRNGNDRTLLFRAPFDGLLSAGRQLVLDGEITVPDDRGVTHISDLQGAIAERQPERLAYFAFDLLHLDGHDLRPCPIEARKELLRRVLEDARCPRLVYVDHVTGHGAELFEHVQTVGAEGIVSKQIGSRYRSGQSRDWRKTKCHATASFVITGFQELGPGRLEALHVVEKSDSGLVPAGQVRFGFAGKGLWAMLDALRTVWAAGSAGVLGNTETFAQNAYITNNDSNTVSVINTATDTVIATVPIGYGPFGVAVSPDGGRVYIGSFGTNTVGVIDTATNTVIATHPERLFRWHCGEPRWPSSLCGEFL